MIIIRISAFAGRPNEKQTDCINEWPLWRGKQVLYEKGDLGVRKKCALHDFFVKTAGSSSKKESTKVQNKKEIYNPSNPTCK